MAEQLSNVIASVSGEFKATRKVHSVRFDAVEPTKALETTVYIKNEAFGTEIPKTDAIVVINTTVVKKS